MSGRNMLHESYRKYARLHRFSGQRGVELLKLSGLKEVPKPGRTVFRLLMVRDSVRACVCTRRLCQLRECILLHFRENGPKSSKIFVLC